MAAHLFSESGQMQEVDIPDIFDVLEGGEDENAVKYLLGFGREEGGEEGVLLSQVEGEEGQVVASTSQAAASALSPTESQSSNDGEGGASTSAGGSGGKPGHVPRKRDTSGLKAIYKCMSCTKAFTTKFNLKRHINMHCVRSKQAGVPVQGPPSANTPSKKPITHRMPKDERDKIKEKKAAKQAAKAAKQAQHQLPTTPVPPSEVASTSGVAAASSGTLVVVNQQGTVAKVLSPVDQSKQQGQPIQLVQQQLQPQVLAHASSALPASLTYQVGTGNSTATVRVQAPTSSSSTSIASSSSNVIPIVSQVSPSQPRTIIHSIVPVSSAAPPGTATVIATGTAAKQDILSPPPASSPSPTPSLNLSPSMGAIQPLPIIQDLQPAVMVEPTNPPQVIRVQQPVAGAAVASTSHHKPITVITTSVDTLQSSTSSTSSSTTHVPLLQTVSAAVSSTSSVTGTVKNTPINTGKALAAPAGHASISVTVSPTPHPAIVQGAAGGGATVQLPKDLFEHTNDPFSPTGSNGSGCEGPPKAAASFVGSLKGATVNIVVQRKPLMAVPDGWRRKPVLTRNQVVIFYYNPSGKKFGNKEDVEEYFSRLGYAVQPGVFDFVVRDKDRMEVGAFSPQSHRTTFDLALKTQLYLLLTYTFHFRIYGFQACETRCGCCRPRRRRR